MHTPERQQILDAMEPGQSYTPTEIAVLINKTPNAVTRLLIKLMRYGMVKKTAYGRYVLPDIAPSDPPGTKPANRGVYVLKCNNMYKIGWSGDVASRVSALRIAMPYEATIVHMIKADDAPQLEAKLHERYAAKHIRGEWFALDVFDVDEILSM